MKKGLILTNAYSSIQSACHQSARLKVEFEKLGTLIDVKQNDYFAAQINHGKIVTKCKEYDFCIYLDKDKYISKMLEQSGLRLFNSSEAIANCDDKMLTHICLSGCGLPMPKTLAGLLCYNSATALKESAVQAVEEAFGYPVIAKASYGSLGNGIYMLKNRTELTTCMEQLKCSPHLFQEVIQPTGIDIRVVVVGGEVVGSMMRSSESDFRSNIELGGIGRSYILTDELRDLSVKVTKIMRLDYCGIDILLNQDGDPFVCEVNSNAFFGKIEQVTGVNVAKKYAEYILRNI